MSNEVWEERMRRRRDVVGGERGVEVEPASCSSLDQIGGGA